MKKKNQDQKDWMWQHCKQCVRKNSQCITPHGVVVGEIGCYIGSGDDRVFCPYNPASLMRFKMMKYQQSNHSSRMKN